MKPKRSLFVAGLCFFLMMGISWQVGAYDEDDLEILKSTGDCSGCDLSEVFLQAADLTEAN
ncbi:MAG: pentapeptide repeat-containing protein, partial [Pseudomonadota bacterium]|nr:pentapeptide repeat-containing protein [Pseudomonadota bacterium]